MMSILRFPITDFKADSIRVKLLHTVYADGSCRRARKLPTSKVALIAFDSRELDNHQVIIRRIPET